MRSRLVTAARRARTIRAVAEERRLVTILFSDVAGSTVIGEELDPDDLRLLLDRYYAIAKDVVAEHGGTLGSCARLATSSRWRSSSGRCRSGVARYLRLT